ncbi:MAG: branched-chain amino acid ABC transporter substrate-binding protein, partial [Trichococcus flocculiformis]
MKKKFLMGLASVFVLAACGNGATTEESDTIKLGGNFELSGGASAYGTLMDEGIKMAVAEQNAADG